MSNYLFAIGSNSSISQIHSSITKNVEIFSNEVSVISISKKISCLIVEKGNDTVSSYCSVDNEYNQKEHIFFKGWFQDHDSESIVFGARGYHTWRESFENPEVLNFEGTYIRAEWDQEKLVIGNDLFSYFPLMFFSTSDIIVASDSLYVLSQVRRMLKLPCKLNHEVIHTRSWTHGIACAIMSNQTQIEGVEYISPGKHIECKLGKRLSTEIIHHPIKEIFKEEHTNYAEAIVKATRQLYASTMSFSHIDGIHINFGLSGGLDSRLLLAILLKNRESLEKVSITTNTHTSRKGDFQIVSNLSEKYDFNFNQKKQELVEHRKNPEVESISVSNSFGYWILSNMGLFDMMYLHNSYWKHPNVIDMGGHGAETVKGTFASVKFSNYIYKPTYLGAILRLFRDISEVRYMRERRSKIRNEMSNGLKSSGIVLAEPGSIQWHHLCYKSPIQNGRFLDRSIIALRPYIQKSLYSLSRSELNPFLNIKKGEPTLLHDMLILLDPELAAEPFENSKNDLTGEYIEHRLQAINRKISFEGIKPYTIYGSVTDIVNGPPNIFMAMVKDYNIDGMEFKEAILRILEKEWAKIEGTKLGDVYQSAYDTAKERLLDPDFYPPSAGTPAAKIISLMMVD